MNLTVAALWKTTLTSSSNNLRVQLQFNLHFHLNLSKVLKQSESSISIQSSFLSKSLKSPQTICEFNFNSIFISSKPLKSSQTIRLFNSYLHFHLNFSKELHKESSTIINFYSHLNLTDDSDTKIELSKSIAIYCSHQGCFNHSSIFFFF